MSGVVSKNLYDLLGNDADEDGPPPVPVQPVDKPTQRTGKRNNAGEAPVRDTPAAAPRGGGRGRGRGRGRGDFSANERAFQDSEAGRERNRDKPADESIRQDGNERRGGGRGRGEGRGGRGGRGRGAPRDDRHNRPFEVGPNDHAKQASKGWGESTGTGEWMDEKAGEAIATEEGQQGFDTWVEAPVNAEGETPTVDENDQPVEQEPEDKTKSYDDYLAEQAEKRLQLGGPLAVRKANEGTKNQLQGQEITRDEDAVYFAGGGGKAGRQRERKEKNVYALDHDIQARERDAPRGGRGGRGGRGRGEGRGDGRGRGRGRGEFRGGPRGGRGGPGGASPNVADTSAFPSLGGS